MFSHQMILLVIAIFQQQILIIQKNHNNKLKNHGGLCQFFQNKLLKLCKSIILAGNFPFLVEYLYSSFELIV